MVDPLAVHRPDNMAAVYHVVAAVSAVVRLARNAVLNRPRVHAQGVGDHVVPVLQVHDSALVELVGLAHQVQVLLIRGVQPGSMLPDRCEPLGHALMGAMPGVGIGHAVVGVGDYAVRTYSIRGGYGMLASGDELRVPWRMDGAKMGHFVRQPMPFNAI